MGGRLYPQRRGLSIKRTSNLQAPALDHHLTMRMALERRLAMFTRGRGPWKSLLVLTCPRSNVTHRPDTCVFVLAEDVRDWVRPYIQIRLAVLVQHGKACKNPPPVGQDKVAPHEPARPKPCSAAAATGTRQRSTVLAAARRLEDVSRGAGCPRAPHLRGHFLRSLAPSSRWWRSRVAHWTARAFVSNRCAMSKVPFSRNCASTPHRSP